MKRRRLFERFDSAAAAYLLIGGIWLVRVAFEGFNGLVFSDAGAYLYAGNSLLNGRGLSVPSGGLFDAHGPVVPILIAAASKLVGGGPFVGPKILFSLIMLASLVGVVRISQLLGGGKAALWTAVGLAAIPFVWSGFLEILIDQPQFGLMVATILLLWKPTTRRVIAAGIVFSVCILAKETAIPAMILPLAWIGAVNRQEVRRIVLLFFGTVAVGALWWWVVVFVSEGVIFPFDQLQYVGSRSKALFGIGPLEVITLELMLGAWLWFFLRERSRPEARLVMLAALGMLPAAAVAVSNEMDFRQLLVIGSLSCVAGGVALAGWLADQGGSRSKLAARRASHLAAAIAVISVPLVARAQLMTQPGEAINIEGLIEWLDDNTEPEERIAISYIHRREILASTNHPLLVGTVIDMRKRDTSGAASRDTRLTLSSCPYCRPGDEPEDFSLEPTDKGWVNLATVRRALVDPKNRLIVITRTPTLARFLLRHFPAVRARYRNLEGTTAWVLEVDRSKLPDEDEVGRILRRNASELAVRWYQSN